MQRYCCHVSTLTWEQPGAPHMKGLSCLSFMSLANLAKCKSKQTESKEHTLTLPPCHAVYLSEALLQGRNCVGASLRGRPFTLWPGFPITHTMAPVKLHSKQVGSGHPCVTLPSWWKLCVIIAKMMDVPPRDTTLSQGK